MENLEKKRSPLFIRRIWQVDNHHFSVEWSDGTSQKWLLADLQKMCPCAACVDEITGQRTADTSKVADDLRAVKIVNIGRYALRIQFQSGCSNGLYRFEDLQRMGEKFPQDLSSTGAH